jgi:hypothetical protein
MRYNTLPKPIKRGVMPRLIVLLKDGYFKTYDCEYQFELNSLNAVIGGWPECAYRSKSLSFIGIKKEMDLASNISIDVWCDEEGHIKKLPFTLLRHSDGHPLSGPLIICFRKEFLTEDGKDIVLRPFDEETTQEIVYYLRASGWIQVVYNELTEDEMPTDTEGMPN